jgi:hypothetical protein
VKDLANADLGKDYKQTILQRKLKKAVRSWLGGDPLAISTMSTHEVAQARYSLHRA